MCTWEIYSIYILQCIYIYCISILYLCVPEWRDLWQTDGLDVDVGLSVEPSSGVLQPDGGDLTQRVRVGQHRQVPRQACVAATHTHTHSGCVAAEQVDVVASQTWNLQPEPLLGSPVLRRQRHLQLGALIQRRNLQLQQDVAHWGSRCYHHKWLWPTMHHKHTYEHHHALKR